MIKEITDSVQTSLFDFIDSFFGFIPDLFIGLVVLLIGYIISRVIRTMIKRILPSVGFDTIMENAGMTDGLKQANIAAPPSAIVASILFWLIFLNFLLAALGKMGLTPAIEPLKQFIALIPSIIVGLVVFVLGTMVAQFLGRVISGATAGMGIEFHEALGSIVRILLICIASIIAIQQMGVDVAILMDLFVNILTIVVIGLAIAFGLGGRSVARNALAGFYARELFQIGDTLSIDGETGTLDSIGTLNSEIRVAGGVISIPNTRLTEDSVKKLD